MQFCDKLELIKERYQLQGKEMAQILGTVYQNYFNYKTGRAMPVFDKVVEMSNYFCISLDWIGGTTNCPYNEEQIICQEQELFSFDKKRQLGVYYDAENGEHIKIFPFFCIKDASIPEQYSKYEQRKKYYTLGARSNIVYLLNYYKRFIIAGTIEDNIKRYGKFKPEFFPWPISGEGTGNIDQFYFWNRITQYHLGVNDFYRKEIQPVKWSNNCMKPLFDLTVI